MIGPVVQNDVTLEVTDEGVASPVKDLNLHDFGFDLTYLKVSGNISLSAEPYGWTVETTHLSNGLDIECIKYSIDGDDITSISMTFHSDQEVNITVGWYYPGINPFIPNSAEWTSVTFPSTGTTAAGTAVAIDVVGKTYIYRLGESEPTYEVDTDTYGSMHVFAHSDICCLVRTQKDSWKLYQFYYTTNQLIQKLDFGDTPMICLYGSTGTFIAPYTAEQSVIGYLEDNQFQSANFTEISALGSDDLYSTVLNDRLYVFYNQFRTVLVFNTDLTLIKTAVVIFDGTLIESSNFKALGARNGYIYLIGIHSSQVEGHRVSVDAIFADTGAWTEWFEPQPESRYNNIQEFIAPGPKDHMWSTGFLSGVGTNGGPGVLNVNQDSITLSTYPTTGHIHTDREFVCPYQDGMTFAASGNDGTIHNIIATQGGMTSMTRKVTNILTPTPPEPIDTPVQNKDKLDAGNYFVIGLAITVIIAILIIALT